VLDEIPLLEEVPGLEEILPMRWHCAPCIYFPLGSDEAACEAVRVKEDDAEVGEV
jgi:hypothetical protein